MQQHGRRKKFSLNAPVGVASSRLCSNPVRPRAKRYVEDCRRCRVITDGDTENEAEGVVKDEKMRQIAMQADKTRLFCNDTVCCRR